MRKLKILAMGGIVAMVLTASFATISTIAEARIFIPIPVPQLNIDGYRLPACSIYFNRYPRPHEACADPDVVSWNFHGWLQCNNCP